MSVKELNISPDPFKNFYPFFIFGQFVLMPLEHFLGRSAVPP